MHGSAIGFMPLSFKREKSGERPNLTWLAGQERAIDDATRSCRTR